MHPDPAPSCAAGIGAHGEWESLSRRDTVDDTGLCINKAEARLQEALTTQMTAQSCCPAARASSDFVVAGVAYERASDLMARALEKPACWLIC